MDSGKRCKTEKIEQAKAKKEYNDPLRYTVNFCFVIATLILCRALALTSGRRDCASFLDSAIHVSDSTILPESIGKKGRQTQNRE